MNTVIRVLVADDHPVVRDGLVAILSTQPDFSIVGQAATGHEAIAQVRRLQPDVLLLDLEMPELDGVGVLRQLQAQSATRALVFTAFDTDERILDALQAGAQGYLLKGAPREELFNAIRVIHAGGSLLQPLIATRLMQQMHQPAPSGEADSLTQRELDVLQLLAHGQQNKEIAAALVISERTVKFHVSSILSKLGVGNRTEAVRRAAQLGIITL